MPTTALQSDPCYAIVIYFIGANNCNDPRRTGNRIINEWTQSVDRVLANCANKGKTLFVRVTIPAEASPYQKYMANNTDRLVPLNNAIRSYAPAIPHVRHIVADCEKVAHDVGDDGLHFLPAGYGQIENVLLTSITNGLALDSQ